MRIRFTSVVTEEISELIRLVTVELQEALKASLSKGTYEGGIEQFAAVIVAVGTQKENNEFVSKHNKLGSYKDFFSKKKIKYISYALPFNPEILINMEIADLKSMFCSELLDLVLGEKIHKLDSINSESFIEDLSRELKKMT